jgi:1,4-alpha-glucan branching enzyme
MAVPIAEGGVGFDYRLGMAIPDFWIRLLKEVPDEQWNVWEIWNIMTDRLPGVGTVAYAESHDQALVGDKTLAFRLMDAAMYSAMERGRADVVVERGMALHKMIRLVTIAAGGDAYLAFMGNEFGHPEWIDFPREGNGWSYKHARRQWSLADDPTLRYSQLGAFDAAMIALVRECGVLGEPYPWRLQMDEAAQTMVFARGTGSPANRADGRNGDGDFCSGHEEGCHGEGDTNGTGGRPDGTERHGESRGETTSGDAGPLRGGGRPVFVFNWHPTGSRPDYAIEVPEPGTYRLLLSTDEERFGGHGRENPATRHFTYTAPDGRHYMQIYNICRTASVFVKI